MAIERSTPRHDATRQPDALDGMASGAGDTFLPRYEAPMAAITVPDSRHALLAASPYASCSLSDEALPILRKMSPTRSSAAEGFARHACWLSSDASRHDYFDEGLPICTDVMPFICHSVSPGRAKSVLTCGRFLLRLSRTLALSRCADDGMLSLPRCSSSCRHDGASARQSARSMLCRLIALRLPI